MSKNRIFFPEVEHKPKDIIKNLFVNKKKLLLCHKKNIKLTKYIN